jgi:putative ABC transport system permease protein
MTENRSSPPPWARKLLLAFIRRDLAEEVDGDLEEKFISMLRTHTLFRARLNYWYQVLHYIRPFAIGKNKNLSVNQYAMFKSYFKIGWRNLLREKGYSIINIGGLAIGMTVAMLIGLWIYDEHTFNKSHDNYSSVAQVWFHGTYSGERRSNTWLTMGVANDLKTQYADNFKHVIISGGTDEHILVVANDKMFTQTGRFMDAAAPEVFSFQMIQGNREGLKNMNSIMISATLAKKFFGDRQALGEVIRIDNVLDAAVAGVYEDFPMNSELRDVQYVAPWELYLSNNKWALEAENVGFNHFIFIYTQLAPGADIEAVSAKIKDTKKKYKHPQLADHNPEVFLHPMAKWHLHSYFENGQEAEGPLLRSVTYYGFIGGFVLLLACINFMNLSTARSERRAREVGIRKSIGSARRQLIQQFLSESMLVAFFAFALAILAVHFMLPWFNGVADKNVHLPLQEPVFWLCCLGFTAFTGFLAGSYPALYLSSFNPVKVMKGTFRVSRFASAPRKALVVVQFVVSILMAVGTVVVYNQLQFAQDRPVGYSREGLVMIRMSTGELKDKYNVLRNELKKTGVVYEVATSGSSLMRIQNWNPIVWKGKEEVDSQAGSGTLPVSHEYGKTVGWQFISGRDFSSAYASDSSAVVINEAAARFMRMEEPVGEVITREKGWGKGDYRIIGVIKDMVMESPYEKAVPTYYFVNGWANWIYIRIAPGAGAHEAIAKIETVFKNFITTAPFEYAWADEAYALKFAQERRISKLAAFYSALAIFISCMGLFGLSAFVAEQRTKEIGIRKVMGASVTSLWRLLSKDFVILVVISCVIALPLAFIVLRGWLLKYEYRITLSWTVFVAVGLAAVVLTLVTISFQSIRAALMNPVRSLRSE